MGKGCWRLSLWWARATGVSLVSGPTPSSATHGCPLRWKRGMASVARVRVSSTQITSPLGLMVSSHVTLPRRRIAAAAGAPSFASLQAGQTCAASQPQVVQVLQQLAEAIRPHAATQVGSCGLRVGSIFFIRVRFIRVLRFLLD